MREFTVNLTPESAARVEEMRSRIGNAHISDVWQALRDERRWQR